VLSAVTANPIQKQAIRPSWRWLGVKTMSFRLPRPFQTLYSFPGEPIQSGHPFSGQPIQTPYPFPVQTIEPSYPFPGQPFQPTYSFPGQPFQPTYPFPIQPIQTPHPFPVQPIPTSFFPTSFPFSNWPSVKPSQINPWITQPAPAAPAVKPPRPLNLRRQRQQMANASCAAIPACHSCLERNYCRKWSSCQKLITKLTSKTRVGTFGWWQLCARDGKTLESPVWACGSDKNCTEYVCTDIRTCQVTDQSGWGREVGNKIEDDELTQEFYGSS